jgi:hypothetical protein
MYYKLIRKAPDGKWVRGTLCQVQHRFSRSQGKQIEYLTPICPTLENLDKQIPALIYRVQVTMSPRFKRLLPLVCQVPGRAGIRIHPGSRPEHSRGCILVPNRGIEAGLTAELIRQQQAKEEIRLEIISPK